MNERIKTSRPMGPLDRLDNRRPADSAQNQIGHGEQPDTHHDELQKIGDQHREHPPDDGIDRHHQQQSGHGDHQVTLVHTADEYQKLAADPQKHPHVQQSTQYNHHTRQPADKLTKPNFEQFRDRHDSRVSQRLHAKPGDADDEHRQGLQDARCRPGKPKFITRLGRIHAGDDAKLGRCQ